MAHRNPNLSEYLSLFHDAIRHGKWLIVFLLALRTTFAFPAGTPRPAPAMGLTQTPAILIPAFAAPVGRASQGEKSRKKLAPSSKPGLEAIQAKVEHVRNPGLQALAGALGLSSRQIGHRAFEDSETGMESISGLAGGAGVVVAVKWDAASPDEEARSDSAPGLYLLSWDGKMWQASFLTSAANALTLRVLPVSGSTAPLIAVIIFRGVTAVPYPVIFQFRDHHASLVWDGRSDSSLYDGYDYGSIQFEKAGSGNVPVMVVAGRADPGLLVFPQSAEQTGRGFQAATVYAWQNNAYVPVRTEYTHNRDYILYRFIDALHLQNFKAAYSLIDPKSFLKTDKPSLKLFRERILNAWPEFTDDKIFEVPIGSKSESGSHSFILRLDGGKINVYHPTFTSGPAYRLTGLQRTGTSE